MFVNDGNVLARLNHNRNCARLLVTDVVREARGLVISPMDTGRPFGVKNIEPSLKPLIALVGEVDGQTKAAAAFSVGNNTVRRAMEDNKDALEKELAPIRSAAIERIAATLGGITDEKLQDVGALNLSNIARNLSTVIGNTRKKDSEEGGTKFQFNIIAPSVSPMKDYEVLDV